MNNYQNLWNKLESQNIVKGQMPEITDIPQPWYVRLMQGFAGWLAALFMLGFFAMAFTSLFKEPSKILLFSVGAMCSIVSYLIFRSKENDFLSQFGLVLSLAGQIMVAFSLFWGTRFNSPNPYFLLALYQLILAWFLPHYMHRLITTGFAVLTLMVGLNLYGVYGIGTALCAVAFSFIWVKDLNWKLNNLKWEAIGYGLALSLVCSQSFLISRRLIFSTLEDPNQSWLYNHSAELSSALVALVFLNLIWVTLKEYAVPIKTKETLLAMVLAFGLFVLSFYIYGISVGLLIVLIGFIRSRKILIALGIFSIIGFFSWFYYNLSMTLLNKSLLLMALGSIMVVGFLFFKFLYKKPEPSKPFVLNWHFSKGKWLVFSTILVLLIGVNNNINKKEKLLSQGEQLLFRLAPVDPRSIMQGDYMRLRFELGNSIRKRFYKNTNQHSIPNTQGFVVVEKGENNVIQFVALWDNQNLDTNQLLIPFKLRNNQIKFTTDAFYFQEGSANKYDKAIYGEYRYKNREMLLVHLIDKDFKTL